MNILIVKAHPSSKGFTHAIASVYTARADKQGHQVRIIDLYTDVQYQQPFLTFDDVHGEWSGQEVRERVQADVQWADELIFVYPIWWAGVPAIMKNFIDNNFTKGFAYTFNKKTKHLDGMLKGKQVKVFATGDAPRIVYMVLRPMMKMLFKKSFVDFCGMKLASFDIFSNMVGCKEVGKRDAILKKVQTRA